MKKGCILYFPAGNKVVITTMIFETFEDGLKFMKDLGPTIKKQTEENGFKKAVYDVSFLSHRNPLPSIEYLREKVEKSKKHNKEEMSNHSIYFEHALTELAYGQLVEKELVELKKAEEIYNLDKSKYDYYLKVRKALFVSYYGGCGDAYEAILEEVQFGKALFSFDLD